MGNLTETDPSAGFDDGGITFAPDCQDPQAFSADGHHRPGEDCLECHTQGTGTGAPPFSIGGTIYTDMNGGQPATLGSPIHLVNANGSDVVVLTAQNGNFWSFDTLAFPVTAYAAQCPTVEPMITPLELADGSCNRAGCHTAGFRVYSSEGAAP